MAPVLSLSEAPDHPHHQARGTYAKVEGSVQPSPAPRFSRTPGAIGQASYPDPAGARALQRWGVPEEIAAAAQTAGVLGQ